MVNRPESANAKGAFLAGESVISALIAREQPAAPEPLPNAAVGRHNARIVGRLVADAWHQQEARVERVALELADIAFKCRVVRPPLDGCGDCFALLVKPRGEVSQGEDPFFVELEQAVERDPAHHLRKGVLAAAAA